MAAPRASIPIKLPLGRPPPLKREGLPCSSFIAMNGVGSGSLRTRKVNCPICCGRPVLVDVTVMVTFSPTFDGRAMYLPGPVGCSVPPPDIVACTLFRGTPGTLTLMGFE